MRKLLAMTLLLAAHSDDVDQSLILTVGLIENIPGAKYKALLTIVPPRPSRDGDEMRQEL